MNIFVRYIFASLCYWLFVIIVILSGIIGVFGAPLISHSLLTFPFTMPFVAIATFLVLYRIVALGMVTLVERAKNIEFDKPSIKWGIIFSAILPFVIAAVLLLLILVGITNGSPDRSASKVSSN